MRKLQLLVVTIILALPLMLSAAFTYLDDPAYEKLSQTERDTYLVNLEAAMAQLQRSKNESIERGEVYQVEIENLRRLLGQTDEEIAQTMARLGITEQDIADIRTKIQYYNDQLNNWEQMSDDELWRNRAALVELREDYNKTKALKLAQLPEFQRDFNDLDRRFNAIQNRADGTRADGTGTYVVQSGDTLRKIAGLNNVYGDQAKWDRIWRANRHQMNNPNDMRVGMRLVIPQGQQTKWTVWRGESLWRIASYPEVYGDGRRWPVIFMENRSKIKHQDLIYPGQQFNIPQPPPAKNPSIN